MYRQRSIVTLIILSSVLYLALVMSACGAMGNPGQEAPPTPNDGYPYPYGTP